MRTIREFTFGRLGYVVPAGSTCQRHHEPNGDGTYSVFVSPHTFPPGSMERHDATYSGIRVAEDNWHEVYPSKTLADLISDAAEGDPGEAGEKQVLRDFTEGKE